MPSLLKPSDGLDLESIHSYQTRVFCRDRHTMLASRIALTSFMEEVPLTAEAQTVSLSTNTHDVASSKPRSLCHQSANDRQGLSSVKFHLEGGCGRLSKVLLCKCGCSYV